MTILKTARQLLSIQGDLYQIDPHKEFDIYMFEQTWGSTALGFSGMGGSKMTTETTFVLIPQYYDYAYVYFGSEFAYKVEKINENFKEDLLKHNMASVMKNGRYK